MRKKPGNKNLKPTPDLVAVSEELKAIAEYLGASPARLVGFVLCGCADLAAKHGKEKKGRLFAIHLSDDSSELRGLRGGQLINSVFQTLLADGSYLINSDFGCFSGTAYL